MSRQLILSVFITAKSKGLSHRAKNHYQHRVVLIESVFWKCRNPRAQDERQKTPFLMSASLQHSTNSTWIGVLISTVCPLPRHGRFASVLPAATRDPQECQHDLQPTLVITSRMGQTAVCMGKETALGKKDTTLPHHYTFTRKIIPATDQTRGWMKRMQKNDMVGVGAQ